MLIRSIILAAALAAAPGFAQAETARCDASAALLIGLAAAPAQAGGALDLLEPTHVAPAGCGFNMYRCITHPQKGRLCYKVPCLERRPTISL